VRERKLKSENGKSRKKFSSRSLTTISDCSSMSLVNTNNHRRIVTTLQEMPRESIQGGEVWSLELGGSYVVGRVMRKSEWIKKRVYEDWEIFREEDMKEFVRELRRARGRLFCDMASMDLHNYRPDGICVPPSPYYLRINAASPSYRTDNLVALHNTSVEAPWIKVGLDATDHYPTPFEEVVRVGTFISLFDEELGELSQGMDSPEFYGQLKEFVGYDEEYAVGVVTVMVYYRNEDQQLTSYLSKEPWPKGTRHSEEALILLQRRRCRFPHMDLVEFGPGELSRDYLMRTARGTGVRGRGPKRTWDEEIEWRHPAVIQREERIKKERERLRFLEEIEGAKEDKMIF